MFKFRVFITAFLLLAALFSLQSNAVQVSQNLNPAVSSHILFTDSIDITKTKPTKKSLDAPAHKKHNIPILTHISQGLQQVMRHFFCTQFKVSQNTMLFLSFLRSTLLGKYFYALKQ
ncbi:hypothetical protein ATS73_007200 [Pseudoalteromonas sp. H100]|nr:hypothetical protein [Pseudoalteromonas sp. H100]WFO20403.1 hypothetical protein ATS73_007200 [Pseudoalteromonas sp. H100]